MGASGWDYVVRFDEDAVEGLFDLTPAEPDPLRAMTELQVKIVAAGDILWEDEEVPQPAGLGELQELWRTEESEWLMESGTHTIVDMVQVLPADSPDEFGALVGVTPEQAAAFFGSARPTPEQFTAGVRSVEELGRPRIHDFPRWSGRWVTVYEGGSPVGYGFWGASGD